jgi:hypothetical protein
MINDNTINMQICHGGDQLRPVLMPSAYLNQHADSDILSFLNAVFTPNSPLKDDDRNFSYETLTIEEIFKKTKKYMGRFRKEDNAKDFIYWVKQCKPAFMSIAAKRKRVMDDQKNELQVRKRSMYVLHEKHWGALLKDI